MIFRIVIVICAAVFVFIVFPIIGICVFGSALPYFLAIIIGFLISFVALVVILLCLLVLIRIFYYISQYD
jgi:hypothetical protein